MTADDTKGSIRSPKDLEESPYPVVQVSCPGVSSPLEGVIAALPQLLNVRFMRAVSSFGGRCSRRGSTCVEECSIRPLHVCAELPPACSFLSGSHHDDADTGSRWPVISGGLCAALAADAPGVGAPV